MYDEVKAYIEARAEYRTAQHDSRGGPDCPGCKADQKWRNETWPARRAALKASSDPLVRWIAENVDSYDMDAAVFIMRALPASMEELDAIADGQDWCSVYAEHRERAKKAGVLPVATPEASER